MMKILLQRLAFLAATTFVVSVLAFLVPYVSGGDPVRTILQSRVGDLAVDEDAVEALRVKLGLERPLHEQYGIWLADALRGDLGISFANKMPVEGEVARALGVSATLAAVSLAFALLLAFPLGTLSAIRPGGRFDTAATFVTQTFVAVPEYWMAPMAILLFSLHLGVLPSAGWRGPSSVVMPALVLSLRPMAYFTRVTRAAMIDVLGAPYITAALSRGLNMRQTVLHHGVRNGVMPVLTLFAMWLAGLLGGSVVVEVIFSIPGMGRLLYEAVINKDIPMLQGGFVCIVILSVVITTIADLLHMFINPAVRAGHVH
ncbi:ABC transporter permease [Agrobacterium rhizogenes]|uniref:ABC transporter permease n=2 Tax=unclassified Rhizobium TaxID=2613769 RepID=A0AAU7SN06_9HYPH|nr:ABC transporter permease [Rhizobium rhizogenes]NTJ77836.1 ABC transporter permease [Rhizobium rhizogenes]